MGTTKDALNAGSVAYKHVVAIEGYPYLLTNATPAQATTAWSGTGYTQALGGLFVDLKTGQAIQPWEAFTPGASFQFFVRDTDSSDAFGIDTHKRNTGAETELVVSLGRNLPTTMTVKDTSGFASSGDAYIGTECFSYSGKTSTTFTGLTRGKYAPFPVAGNVFAQHHRVVDDVASNNPRLQPLVTANPRVWVGKWCGVWIHRYVNGVLDTKAEAHLAFAGRITDIQDTPELVTAVTVKHVLDFVREATVFRDGWHAKIQPGIRLELGQEFNMAEYNGTTLLLANSLTVVSGAPANVYEIKEGFYTTDDLYGAINNWLADAWNSGDLHSNFWMWEAPSRAYPTPHVKIYWDRSAAYPATSYFQFAAPLDAMLSFGFVPDDVDINENAVIERSKAGSSKPQHIIAQNEPDRAGLFKYDSQFGTGFTASLVEQQGSFTDQYAFYPPSEASIPQGGLEWGYFLVNNEFLLAGALEGNELTRCRPPAFRWAGAPGIGPLEQFQIPAGQEYVEVKQILILSASLSNLLKYFFFSTGNAITYNHATWDILGFGLGLGIPAPLLGSTFLQSVDALPGAHVAQLAVIDRPIKFVDMFTGDLVFRRAFLRWKDGGLQFRTWITPTASAAIATLTDSNKATALGDTENPRSSTVETEEWQRPIVKILYNRDVTDLSNADGYRSTLTFEDAVAIDDAGGDAATMTIKARNTYDEGSAGGVVRAVAAEFLASFPLHSRPARRLERSMAPTLYEKVAVGDIVTLTDGYARDPDTGRRVVSARPAFVTKTNVMYGGASHDGGSRSPMGEVELFLLDRNRTGPYVPSAYIDDTADAGGFSSGYNSLTVTIRCYAHRYSLSSEAADASHFEVDDIVRVIEIDPANPASPQYWDTFVDSVSGNDIALGNALTGWDATKYYRIIFDSYADCEPSQQLHTFHADDADGLVDDLANARQYAIGQGDSPTGITLAAVTDEVELPAEISYADGEGRDVGTDLALARLLNNLIDFKCANHSPQLGAVMSGSGGTFNLVMITPMYTTLEQLGVITRKMLTAVFMRSTNGASASVRVTLARDCPSEDTLADVERGSLISEATFTSSSTTWGTTADQELNLNVKTETGFVWILIEVTSNAETRGLAKFVEQEREGYAVIGV